jgi:hypothetical protein
MVNDAERLNNKIFVATSFGRERAKLAVDASQAAGWGYLVSTY